ncbi:Putative oxidoreductase Fe-S subunit [Escherichia coli]
MLRPGLIDMFATVQLLFCLYYLWEFQGLFSRVLHHECGNDSNLLIVFYVQIMPDDFVMQLHRF